MKPGDEAPAEYVDDPALTPEQNAEKKAAFDKEKSDKAADKPIDPASYKITLAEGESLAPEVEKEFREYAASKKLSQEDIDKLTGMQRAVQKAAAQRLADNVEKWGGELRADKEVGGPLFKENMAAARLAVKNFFPASLRPVLNQTGLGQYPDFVRGMVRIGKLMKETGTMPGGVAEQQTTAEVLYGGSES